MSPTIKAIETLPTPRTERDWLARSDREGRLWRQRQRGELREGFLLDRPHCDPECRGWVEFARRLREHEDRSVSALRESGFQTEAAPTLVRQARLPSSSRCCITDRASAAPNSADYQRRDSSTRHQNDTTDRLDCGVWWQRQRRCQAAVDRGLGSIIAGIQTHQGSLHCRLAGVD